MGRASFGLFGASGFGQTQLQVGGRIRADSRHLGMYLSVPVGRALFADVSALYGESDNTVQRTQVLPWGVVRGNGLVETKEWLLQVGLGGQLFGGSSRWSVVPSVRVAYAGVHQDSALERGAGELGVGTRSKRDGTLFTRTGVDVAREGRVLRVPVRVTGSAAWVHDFASDLRRLGMSWQGAQDTPWSLTADRRLRDALRLGMSLELGLGERRTLRLYGEQELMQGLNLFRGGVTFTIGF